jgi:hypothetical protein
VDGKEQFASIIPNRDVLIDTLKAADSAKIGQN